MHINGGRYPQNNGAFDPDSITVDTSTSYNRLTLRLDDKVHPDFWIELSISRKELETLLQKMKESEE